MTPTPIPMPGQGGPTAGIADPDAYTRLREQLTGLPLALIEWDGDQRVVGYSARAQEVFGFAPEEVLGKRYDEIPWITDEDWAMARAEADAMRTAGRPDGVVVVRNRRKDGTTVHCEWYTSAQHGPQGELLSMLSLVLDVTDRVHAREALRINEARARAVMENVRDQVVLLEAVRTTGGTIVDWRFVDSNPAAQELLETGREILGRTMRTVFGDGIATARHALLARVLETGEPHRYEAAFRGRTLLVTLSRIDADHVVSASVDITDRKRAEEALREREGRLRRLVEANPIGVVEGDAEGGIVEANDAFLRIIGHTRTELAAGAIRWDGITPPEHLPADRRAVAEAIGRGVSSIYEKEYVRSDGRRVPVLVACASFGDAGGLVAFVADITDRKRAEEALRAELVARERREAHQALLADVAEDFARLSTEEEITREIGRRLAAHLGISVCSLADIAGGICRVRAVYVGSGAVSPPAELRMSDYVSSGIEAEARLGKTIVVGDVRTDGRVDGARAEALGVRAAVMVPLHRDGRWEHSFQVGTPEARAWRADEVQLLQDVAVRLFARIERARAEEELRRSNEELRAARARLEEADRRKDEFLAVLSHELRNPLAPIRNSIQLLDHAPGGEVGRRAREVLRRQTEHLVRLVSDLLDVTRITHGKIDLRLARVDARELARRTFADAAMDFEQRGVELVLGSSGPGPRSDAPIWVEADEARFGQMITNLLNNALKFTPRGGRVHLDVERTGGACEVRVRDTGIGIAAEDLRRIFEPFVQVERTRRTHGGVGIGLALVRQLAELQGGAVHAESRGPGEGAEFVIRLPLAPATPDDAGRRTLGRHGRAAVPLSILVVDDNEDAALTLADLLGFLGHTVATAHTGRAGIDALAARIPDVLLCDVGLPDMTGYDVIREVRARPGGLGVFAVALTGYAQPRDREVAIAAGFDAHLGKPAALDDVIDLLVRAPRGRREASPPAPL